METVRDDVCFWLRSGQTLNRVWGLWQPTDICGHGHNMTLCENTGKCPHVPPKLLPMRLLIASPARAQRDLITPFKMTRRAVRPSKSLHLQWRVSPPTLPAGVQPPSCCFPKPTAALVGKQPNCGCSFPHFFKATLAQSARRLGGTPARLSSWC